MPMPCVVSDDCVKYRSFVWLYAFSEKGLRGESLYRISKSPMKLLWFVLYLLSR